MFGSYEELVRFCESDRDVLLATYAERRGLSVMSVPSQILDDLIEGMLGIGIEYWALPGGHLGMWDYRERRMLINTRTHFTVSRRPTPTSTG